MNYPYGGGTNKKILALPVRLKTFHNQSTPRRQHTKPEHINAGRFFKGSMEQIQAQRAAQEMQQPNALGSLPCSLPTVRNVSAMESS
jgi:hypothetical protein